MYYKYITFYIILGVMVYFIYNNSIYDKKKVCDTD